MPHEKNINAKVTHKHYFSFILKNIHYLHNPSCFIKEKIKFSINVILIVHTKWFSAMTFQQMVSIESIIKATLESLQYLPSLM